MAIKIFLAGYYGFGNLGDELILLGIKSAVERRYPGARLTVLSAHPHETASLHGVRAVSRKNPLAILLHLWRSDLFVLGGGGLIQDRTSFRSLAYYLVLVRLAAFFQTPVFLYAIGVESVRRRISRALVRRILADPLVTISVRDRESMLALEYIGISSFRIHLTKDPVFSLPTGPSDPVRFEERPRILFIPRFPCPPEGLKLYASLLGWLRNEGILTTALLFQPSREAGAAAQLLSQAGVDVLTRTTPRDVFDVFRRFDLVLSARFHGLVVAAMSQRPFVALGEFEKTGRFAEAWGMPFVNWTAPEEALKKALTQALAMPTQNRRAALEDWRRLSSQTFEFVT